MPFGADGRSWHARWVGAVFLACDAMRQQVFTQAEAHTSPRATNANGAAKRESRIRTTCARRIA